MSEDGAARFEQWVFKSTPLPPTDLMLALSATRQASQGDSSHKPQDRRSLLAFAIAA